MPVVVNHVGVNTVEENLVGVTPRHQHLTIGFPSQSQKGFLLYVQVFTHGVSALNEVCMPTFENLRIQGSKNTGLECPLPPESQKWVNCVWLLL